MLGMQVSWETRGIELPDASTDIRGVIINPNVGFGSGAANGECEIAFISQDSQKIFTCRGRQQWSTVEISLPDEWAVGGPISAIMLGKCLW